MNNLALEIQFRNSKQRYTNNDLVEGVVVIVARSSVAVDKIIVWCQCNGETKISGTGERSIEDTQEFYKNECTLMTRQTLNAGKYEFPFAFRLPADPSLPETYSSGNVSHNGTKDNKGGTCSNVLWEVRASISRLKFFDITLVANQQFWFLPYRASHETLAEETRVDFPFSPWQVKLGSDRSLFRRKDKKPVNVYCTLSFPETGIWQDPASSGMACDICSDVDSVLFLKELKFRLEAITILIARGQDFRDSTTTTILDLKPNMPLGLEPVKLPMCLDTDDFSLPVVFYGSCETKILEIRYNLIVDIGVGSLHDAKFHKTHQIRHPVKLLPVRVNKVYPPVTTADMISLGLKSSALEHYNKEERMVEDNNIVEEGPYDHLAQPFVHYDKDESPRSYKNSPQSYKVSPSYRGSVYVNESQDRAPQYDHNSLYKEYKHDSTSRTSTMRDAPPKLENIESNLARVEEHQYPQTLPTRQVSGHEPSPRDALPKPRVDHLDSSLRTPVNQQFLEDYYTPRSLHEDLHQDRSRDEDDLAVSHARMGSDSSLESLRGSEVRELRRPSATSVSSLKAPPHAKGARRPSVTSQASSRIPSQPNGHVANRSAHTQASNASRRLSVQSQASLQLDPSPLGILTPRSKQSHNQSQGSYSANQSYASQKHANLSGNHSVLSEKPANAYMSANHSVLSEKPSNAYMSANHSQLSANHSNVNTSAGSGGYSSVNGSVLGQFIKPQMLSKPMHPTTANASIDSAYSGISTNRTRSFSTSSLEDVWVPDIEEELASLFMQAPVTAK